MKNIYSVFGLFMLVVALFSAASCGKESAGDCRYGEFTLTVSMDDSSVTKGHVAGTSLVDDVTGSRPLYISAYLYAQSGSDVNYIVDGTFSNDAGAWRHVPAIYWPVGGTLDMIVYSASDKLCEEDVIWGYPNASERLRLVVGNDRLHDDILYGAVWHKTFEGGSSSVEMHHTQAWIQVSLRLVSSPDVFPVTVEKVYLKDVHDSGMLCIENNYGHPTLDWDFRTFVSKDVIVDEGSGIYGTPLGNDAVVLDMMLPEQPMTSLVICYTGLGYYAERTIELPHATWLAGSRYVYEVTFTGSDVVHSSSVASWDDNVLGKVEFPVD